MGVVIKKISFSKLSNNERLGLKDYSLLQLRKYILLKNILIDNDSQNGIKSGRTPSKFNEQYWNGEYEFLTMQDVDKSVYIINDDCVEKITDYAIDEEKTLFKATKGDLIFSNAMTVGLAFEINRDIFINQNIFALKVDYSKYSKTFLKWYFNLIFKPNFDKVHTSKYLSKEEVSKIRLPKIPILTQIELENLIQPIEIKIICLKKSKLKSLEIINKVFSQEFGLDWEFYKDFGKGMTAGTQQSNIKEKSIYKVAFSQFQKSGIVRISSRFHNPKTQFLNSILFSKPAIKVKDIVFEKVHRGASPNYNADGEIPVVKTAHLKNGNINISEDEFVSYDTYLKSERSQIYSNDVLIASTGKVSLGRVDIVETEQELVVDGHISIIRVDNKKYNPQFLTYFLRSILGVFQIERDYTGATNQIELYSSEIENFDIPDFSLAKQSEIVEKIKTQIDAQNEIDKQIEDKQQEINKIIESAIQYTL